MIFFTTTITSNSLLANQNAIKLNSCLINESAYQSQFKFSQDKKLLNFLWRH